MIARRNVLTSSWFFWLGLSGSVHLAAFFGVNGSWEKAIPVDFEASSPTLQTLWLSTPVKTTSPPPEPLPLKTLTSREKTSDWLATPEPESPPPDSTRKEMEAGEDIPESALPEPSGLPQIPESPPVMAESSPQRETLADPLPRVVDPVRETPGAKVEKGPRPLRQVPPPYPRSAILRKWSGEVWLKLVIGQGGKPASVEVLDGSGYRILDQSARNTVLRQWRYEPDQAGQEAVICVRFTLDDLAR